MSFIFSISFSSYFEFQKQARWYLLILLLKFFFFPGSVIFNSIQYSVTSYVMRRKPLLQLWVSFQTAPVLHFQLGSFSLGLLSDLPSCVSPLFSAQGIPEQYFESNSETSLDPRGLGIACFYSAATTRGIGCQLVTA